MNLCKQPQHDSEYKRNSQGEQNYPIEFKFLILLANVRQVCQVVKELSRTLVLKV